MDTFDKSVQEFADFLAKNNNTHSKIIIKLLSLINEVPDEIKVSLAFKLHFMYGYHYNMNKEEIYELWKEKKLFK